ncbi:MAG: SGNH/GDSL hydrolase family protein [Bacteroidales bacterium]|nr:SGNH/GDSL hydrolase family protein [Bacteroidales bacterium]
MADHPAKPWSDRHPVLMLSLVVLGCLLIVDIITGWIFIPFDYNAFRRPDPVFHHGLVPMASETGRWGECEYPFLTNSLGFRDGSSRHVPADTSCRRILFIGDSYTEGVGVTWEESFCGILSNRMGHDDIEVLNAAVVSYSPVFYYLKTKYLSERIGMDFNDLVVMVDNSDPMNELTYQGFEPYEGRWFKQMVQRLKRFLYHQSYLYYSVSRLLPEQGRNEITQSWNRKMGAALTDETDLESAGFIEAIPSWSSDKVLFEKYGSQGIDLALKNMDLLANYCRMHNIRMHVVIYPWPLQIIQRDLSNVQVGIWREFSRATGCGFLNLYPAFISEKNPGEVIRECFIPQDVHWNPEGHRIVADHLQDYLGSGSSRD